MTEEALQEFREYIKEKVEEATLTLNGSRGAYDIDYAYLEGVVSGYEDILDDLQWKWKKNRV